MGTVASQVEQSLAALRSILFSVSSQWTNDARGGWQEFPATTGSAPGTYDAWSTAQALELLTVSLSNFLLHGYSLSSDVEVSARTALSDGSRTLITQNSYRQTTTRRLRHFFAAHPDPYRHGSTRRRSSRPAAASPLPFFGEPSSLEPGPAFDVMGLVWQLRAATQMARRARLLRLDTNAEQLIVTGEGIFRDLLATRSAEGGWSSFGLGGKSAYATAMVVWAVAESHDLLGQAPYLRPHKVHTTHMAVEWLLRNRLRGSGIPFFEGGGTPSVSRTALGAIAIWARRQGGWSVGEGALPRLGPFPRPTCCSWLSGALISTPASMTYKPGLV